MNDENEIVAMVGTTGGAGTTRLTVELGATLARAGRSVALLDASYATQGLSRYVSGRLESDITALLDSSSGDRTDDPPLDAALVDLPVELPARLAACPARAPFQRMARAKTPDSAERFAELVDRASATFDHVLVDVPPVATNPAVAAVTAADRVALVAPNSARGSDGVQRLRGVLADVGTASDVVVANRTTGADAFDGADVAVPESETVEARRAPASVRDVDTEFAPAVARATEAVLDVSLDLEFPEEGLLDVDFERHLPERLT